MEKVRFVNINSWTSRAVRVLVVVVVVVVVVVELVFLNNNYCWQP